MGRECSKPCVDREKRNQDLKAAFTFPPHFYEVRGTEMNPHPPEIVGLAETLHIPDDRIHEIRSPSSRGEPEVFKIISYKSSAVNPTIFEGIPDRQRNIYYHLVQSFPNFDGPQTMIAIYRMGRGEYYDQKKDVTVKTLHLSALTDVNEVIGHLVEELRDISRDCLPFLHFCGFYQDPEEPELLKLVFSGHKVVETEDNPVDRSQTISLEVIIDDENSFDHFQSELQSILQKHKSKSSILCSALWTKCGDKWIYILLFMNDKHDTKQRNFRTIDVEYPEDPLVFSAVLQDSLVSSYSSVTNTSFPQYEFVEYATTCPVEVFS
eukprot:TRINITY_DN9551_c0_g2_i1.p1 TRINITY_DN9551_c0_g2~~TRINITY_DN9551_c0_g2_i1.p1  ORF type:complete len:322 (-),score=32.13 TRINITY_DN9551_c0_g2_i1:99-1064(-)